MIEISEFKFLSDLYKTFLEDILEDKVSHAYLFYGREGVGKKSAAHNFAQMLMCSHPSENGKCDTCENCLLNQGAGHPDLYVFTTEDKKTISVDSIRDMIKDVYIKPFTSEKKVYIIPEADKLTVAAQNALLKVLEEPPYYAVFILICTEISNIIDTVLSRTIKIAFDGASDDEIRKMISEQYPSSDIDSIVAAAGGSIGLAKRLAEDNTLIMLQKDGLNELMKVISEDETFVFSAVSFFDKQKENAVFLLDFWIGVLRDMLVFKAGRAEYVSYKIYRKELSQLTGKLSVKAIIAMIETIQTAQAMLVRYINLREVTYRMLLQIEEDKHE